MAVAQIVLYFSQEDSAPCCYVERIEEDRSDGRRFTTYDPSSSVGRQYARCPGSPPCSRRRLDARHHRRRRETGNATTRGGRRPPSAGGSAGRASSAAARVD